MKEFSAICEALRKSMQEMNSPEESSFGSDDESKESKEYGAAFVHNIKLLENAFNEACLEARRNKPKDKFPHAVLWVKLLDLVKEIQTFLESLENATAQCSAAAISRLTFLQNHFTTIHGIFKTLSSSPHYAGRNDVRNSWRQIFVALTSFDLWHQRDVYKNKIAQYSLQLQSSMTSLDDSALSEDSVTSDYSVSDAAAGGSAAGETVASDSDTLDSDTSDSAADSAASESRSQFESASVDADADASDEPDAPSAQNFSGPGAGVEAGAGAGVGAGVGVEESTSIDDLSTRFTQAFAQMEGASDLNVFEEALSALEAVLKSAHINSKNGDELRNIIFSEDLGEKLDNIAVMLKIKITTLDQGDIKSCGELQNGVRRLEAILNNQVFSTHNTSSLEDVQRTLEEINEAMTSNPDFVAVPVIPEAVDSDITSEQNIRNPSAGPGADVDTDTGADTGPGSLPSRETKDRSEIEELRRLGSSTEALLEYFEQQKNADHSGYACSKEALLYITAVISQAWDAHQYTFDRRCKDGPNVKAAARRPWEFIEADIRQPQHLDSTVRHLLQEITAKFDTFTIEDVSRLCEHLANCRILHTGLFEQLEKSLMEKFFNFDVARLDADCLASCEAAQLSMSRVRIKKQKNGVAAETTETKVAHEKTNIAQYPEVTEISHIAKYLETMCGQDPEMIHRTLVLAAIAVSNTIRKELHSSTEVGPIEAAASIGRLAHSLGILSHYLPTHEEGAKGLQAKRVIRQLQKAILLYSVKITTRILQDNQMDPGALGKYKSGIHSMANQTRQFVEQSDLDEHRGFLQECLEAVQLEKNDPDQTRFANKVALAISNAYGLTVEEGNRVVSNGQTGPRKVFLRTEHLITPFHYDFLLKKGNYFYTIEANGKAYHYLITLFSDNRPPCFDRLDGKSFLKRQMVHGKRLKLSGKDLCSAGEPGKTIIAIDIPQSEFEVAHHSKRDKNYIRYILNTAENKMKAEERAARIASQAAAAAAAVAMSAEADGKLNAEEAARLRAEEEKARMLRVAEEIHQREQERAAEEAREREEQIREQMFQEQMQREQMQREQMQREQMQREQMLREQMRRDREAYEIAEAAQQAEQNERAHRLAMSVEAVAAIKPDAVALDLSTADAVAPDALTPDVVRQGNNPQRKVRPTLLDHRAAEFVHPDFQFLPDAHAAGPVHHSADPVHHSAAAYRSAAPRQFVSQPHSHLGKHSHTHAHNRGHSPAAGAHTHSHSHVHNHGHYDHSQFHNRSFTVGPGPYQGPGPGTDYRYSLDPRHDQRHDPRQHPHFESKVSDEQRHLQLLEIEHFQWQRIKGNALQTILNINSELSGMVEQGRRIILSNLSAQAWQDFLQAESNLEGIALRHRNLVFRHNQHLQPMQSMQCLQSMQSMQPIQSMQSPGLPFLHSMGSVGLSPLPSAMPQFAMPQSAMPSAMPLFAMPQSAMPSAVPQFAMPQSVMPSAVPLSVMPIPAMPSALPTQQNLAPKVEGLGPHSAYQERVGAGLTPEVREAGTLSAPLPAQRTPSGNIIIQINNPQFNMLNVHAVTGQVVATTVPAAAPATVPAASPAIPHSVAQGKGEPLMFSMQAQALTQAKLLAARVPEQEESHPTFGVHQGIKEKPQLVEVAGDLIELDTFSDKLKRT